MYFDLVSLLFVLPVLAFGCLGDSVILGFHVTSPKFKPRNYLFFRVSPFMMYYRRLNIFINKSLVSKGSLFCDRGRLNFQAFV